MRHAFLWRRVVAEIVSRGHCLVAGSSRVILSTALGAIGLHDLKLMQLKWLWQQRTDNTRTWRFVGTVVSDSFSLFLFVGTLCSLLFIGLYKFCPTTLNETHAMFLTKEKTTRKYQCNSPGTDAELTQYEKLAHRSSLEYAQRTPRTHNFFVPFCNFLAIDFNFFFSFTGFNKAQHSMYECLNTKLIIAKTKLNPIVTSSYMQMCICMQLTQAQ